MKKIFLIVISCFLLAGCGKYSETGIIKKLENKIDNTSGYKIKGELTINNGEDKYIYNVDVSYKKKDYYRVSLQNKSNSHEQIILKNKDGVYVLTPSLNKSFKFQSDWPYNNSQIYLLQTLLTDMQNDKDRKLIKNNNQYIYTTTVNYSNNKELVKQQIYLDKKLNLTKVEIMNKKNDIQMLMKFKKIDWNTNYNKNYFDLNSNMKVSKNDNIVKSVSKIDTVIYPMYVPKNTKLTSQNNIKLKQGERVIMTFAGDNPFSLIQETVTKNEDSVVIPVSGEPYLLAGGIGVLSSDSVNWVNNDVEYYLVSSALTENQLISVANSVSVVSAQK